MKNIKNINGNDPKDHKFVPMTLIESTQPTRSKRQRTQVCCAFHPNQLITNFCKNLSCLLPLCPKCVKIHIQQHAESGKFANFQAIQDCLDQVHNCLANSLSNVKKLQKMSSEIEQRYQNKKNDTMIQFNRIKQKVYEHLQKIFYCYEQAIKQQMKRDDDALALDLASYHNSVGSIMESCRIISNKFNSKNTVMQGLIGFYSKYDLNLQFKECEDKLNQIQFCKIQMTTNDKQLQKIEPIIHKYIRIGSNLPASQNTIKQDNKQIGIQGSISNQQVPPPTPNMKSEPDSVTESLAKVQYKFQNFKTPLDEFCLERSRNTRISLRKHKNISLP